jgi:hypothetical protein
MDAPLKPTESVAPITLSDADVVILDSLRGTLSREDCLGLLLRVANCGLGNLRIQKDEENESLRLQISNLMLLLKQEMALTERLKSGKPQSPQE